jgi:hypothetical protein
MNTEPDGVLFCPRFGDALQFANGEWRCIRGDMQLSKQLSEALFDIYLRRTRSVAARPFTFTVGGT